MSSPQCRELLAKSQIFKKESTTSAEESKARACQESDGVYHTGVLTHFARGRQRSILLKSQADRISANDSWPTHRLVYAYAAFDDHRVFARRSGNSVFLAVKVVQLREY
jgi:hypothetical protein